MDIRFACEHSGAPDVIPHKLRPGEFLFRVVNEHTGKLYATCHTVEEAREAAESLTGQGLSPVIEWATVGPWKPISETDEPRDGGRVFHSLREICETYFPGSHAAKTCGCFPKPEPRVWVIGPGAGKVF